MPQTFGRMGELVTTRQATLHADAHAVGRPRHDRVQQPGYAHVRKSLAALVAAGRYRVLALTKIAATAPASPAGSPAPPAG